MFAGHGRRVFSNYPSAEAGRDSVTDAIQARVAKGKTLELGAWDQVKGDLDAHNISDYFVFPMGAVSKPHQPWILRPTSDRAAKSRGSGPFGWRCEGFAGLHHAMSEAIGLSMSR